MMIRPCQYFSCVDGNYDSTSPPLLELGLISGIRSCVAGVRHGRHLVHHDPLHGASLGGVQSQPGQAGQAECQCSEECRHRPVAARHNCGATTIAGLQQVPLYTKVLLLFISPRLLAVGIIRKFKVSKVKFSENYCFTPLNFSISDKGIHILTYNVIY